MASSPARIAANRLNSLRSTGPKNGSIASRRNSLKHGMTGDGVVLTDDDQAEVERRADAFVLEFRVVTEAGREAAIDMAVASVQKAHAATFDIAARASRRRNAPRQFDIDREAEADRLLEDLREEPRTCLRKLKSTPEGLDRLVDEWKSLRLALSREGRPNWHSWHLVHAANLVGAKEQDAIGTEFYPLSYELWGPTLGPLDESKDRDKKEAAKRAKARETLIERIDAELAKLESARSKIDLELIEWDRAEAGDRSLFDDSAEAARARRYEAAAGRRYEKALARLLQVEAEAKPNVEEPDSPADLASQTDATDFEAKISATLASFCIAAPSTPFADSPVIVQPPIGDDSGAVEPRDDAPEVDFGTA